MTSNRIAWTVLLCVWVTTATADGLRGETLSASAFPDEKVEIRGSWLMFVPALESENGLAFDVAVESLQEAMLQQPEVEDQQQHAEFYVNAVNDALAQHSYDASSRWQDFSLVIDGQRRHFRLFKRGSGELVRDVSFDGQREVQHFADSGQANVFLGKSHIFIPSMRQFFPLSTQQLASDNWRAQDDPHSYLLQSQDNESLAFRVRLDHDMKEVVSYEPLNAGEPIHHVLATHWQNFCPEFRQPTAIAKIQREGPQTKAINVYVVKTCESLASVPDEEFVISAPAGTNVIRGGQGSPTIATMKLDADEADVGRMVSMTTASPITGQSRILFLVGSLLLMVGGAMLFRRFATASDTKGSP